MACVETDSVVARLTAIKFDMLNDLTPQQRNGLDVLIRVYNRSKDKYTFRKLFEKIIDISKKSPNPDDSVIYLTHGFKVLLDMMPYLENKMTERALFTLTQMLLHGGPTDKFSSTLGVFHCIKSVLDDPLKFGLRDDNFAIMVEVADYNGHRFVDVVFYKLDLGQSPNDLLKMKPEDFIPDNFLCNLEVKWYEATSDIASQYDQLMMDIIKSVDRGLNMRTGYWMTPSDYPRSKIDDLIADVVANLDSVAKDAFPQFNDAQKAAAVDEVIDNLNNSVFQPADAVRAFLVMD